MLLANGQLSHAIFFVPAERDELCLLEPVQQESKMSSAQRRRGHARKSRISEMPAVRKR
jgi:hypothetical protein